MANSKKRIPQRTRRTFRTSHIRAAPRINPFRSIPTPAHNGKRARSQSIQRPYLGSPRLSSPSPRTAGESRGAYTAVSAVDTECSAGRATLKELSRLINVRPARRAAYLPARAPLGGPAEPAIFSGALPLARGARLSRRRRRRRRREKEPI